MKTKNKLSLATAMALLMALITAVAMGVYAIIQYSLMPDQSILNLMFRHSWHVLVLGLFSYCVLYFVLYHQVVKPFIKIYQKCYAITKGDFSKLDLESPIKEIQLIIDGINMMESQIEMTKTQIEK
ncbi:MAG: hypothetical protein L3J71_02945 [Victivallaceae bacterium]|nr:hypothetical protein [Victivallaceae bacterium]